MLLFSTRYRHIVSWSPAISKAKLFLTIIFSGRGLLLLESDPS